MKILAIITARKNSKRLKNKNKKLLGNKPLVSWTIDFAKKIEIFKDILMTTDDEDIFNLSKEKKILAPWLRPKRIALDNTSSYSTVDHCLKWYENKVSSVDCICLLQPTSPFRSKKNLLEAIKIFKKTKNSVISVMLKKIKKNDTKKKNENKFRNIFIPSGSFFLISPKELEKYKSFINEKNNLYLINNFKENIDINTINDWKIAKRHVS